MKIESRPAGDKKVLLQSSIQRPASSIFLLLANLIVTSFPYSLIHKREAKTPKRG